MKGYTEFLRSIEIPLKKRFDKIDKNNPKELLEFYIISLKRLNELKDIDYKTINDDTRPLLWERNELSFFCSLARNYLFDYFVEQTVNLREKIKENRQCKAHPKIEMDCCHECLSDAYIAANWRSNSKS